MSDIESRQKYMAKAEIAVEVADLAGVTSYDPSREAHGPADFRKAEVKKIYEAVTGEPPEELSQREMNHLIMRELDAELHASYPYDLSRKDLKIIHRELQDNNND